MERWLSYDDISLIPTTVSMLSHRSEADTSVQFGPVNLGLPLVSAPMPDISGVEMIVELAKLGSLGWIHRFDNIYDRAGKLAKIGKTAPGFGVAISANNAMFEVEWAHENYGASIFVIDTANGASTMVERAIKALKDKFPDIFIVAGNVASREAFYALESWGADAIRVGIGSGSVCETRTETGVYSPMASVVQSIKRTEINPNDWYGLERRVIPRKALLIADGGIKTPGDMCKALALGADVVMAGGIFAGTDEAPGEELEEGYKKFSGAASYAIQEKSGRNEIVYVEGKTTIVPPKGPVGEVIKRYAAGLRSSMSYMNARNLTEYRTNVKIVEI